MRLHSRSFETGRICWAPGADSRVHLKQRNRGQVFGCCRKNGTHSIIIDQSIRQRPTKDLPPILRRQVLTTDKSGQGRGHGRGKVILLAARPHADPVLVHDPERAVRISAGELGEEAVDRVDDEVSVLISKPEDDEPRELCRWVGVDIREADIETV